MTMMMQTSSKSSLHPPGRSNVVTTALRAARINEFSILEFHNPHFSNIVKNSTMYKYIKQLIPCSILHQKLCIVDKIKTFSKTKFGNL